MDSKTLLENAGKQLVKVGNAKTMWAATGFMAMFYCAPGIATASVSMGFAPAPVVCK